MRRFLLLPAALIAIAFVVSGCGPGTTLGSLYDVATRQFTNPVTPTNLYQAKLAFEASQKVVLKYQRDCFGSSLPPYPVSVAVIKADPVLSVECSHRVSRYNVMKDAEGKADNAILRADTFIVRNPTGNATSYISAAIRAVLDYQAKAGG